MRRLLLNLAAAVSLALFGLGVALWIRTAHDRYNVRFSRATEPGAGRVWECVDVSAHVGLLQVGRMVMRGQLPDDGAPRDGKWRVQTELAPGSGDLFVAPRRLGFAYHDRAWDARPGVPRRSTAVVVPLWFVLLLSAMLPMISTRAALRRRRRERWLRQGRCAGCGYDLRGTPDRCPECGMAPHEPPHNPTMQRTEPAV